MSSIGTFDCYRPQLFLSLFVHLILLYLLLPCQAFFKDFLPRIADELFSWVFHQPTVLYDLLQPFKGQRSCVVVCVSTVSGSNSDHIAVSLWSFLTFILWSQTWDYSFSGKTLLSVVFRLQIWCWYQPCQSISLTLVLISTPQFSRLLTCSSRFWVFSANLWSMSFGSCKQKVAQGLLVYWGLQRDSFAQFLYRHHSFVIQFNDNSSCFT